MDDYVDAIIRVKVPKWQIGEEVSVHFPDTMMKRGKCEILDESVIQEGVDYSLYIEGYKAGKKDFEPKQGKWIDVVNSGYPSVWHYECSECHGRPLCTPFTKEDFLSKFCPHCGADMRGEE